MPISAWGRRGISRSRRLRSIDGQEKGPAQQSRRQGGLSDRRPFGGEPSAPLQHRWVGPAPRLLAGDRVEPVMISTKTAARRGTRARFRSDGAAVETKPEGRRRRPGRPGGENRDLRAVRLSPPATAEVSDSIADVAYSSAGRASIAAAVVCRASGPEAGAAPERKNRGQGQQRRSPQPAGDSRDRVGTQPEAALARTKEGSPRLSGGGRIRPSTAGEDDAGRKDDTDIAATAARWSASRATRVISPGARRPDQRQQATSRSSRSPPSRRRTRRAGD